MQNRRRGFVSSFKSRPSSRPFESLESRTLMCLEHAMGQSFAPIEERPDLVNVRASGDANDPADIVWVNRGSATSDTDGFNAKFGAAAATARAVVDAVIVAYERMIVSFNYASAGQTYNLTVNMNAVNSGFGASAGLNSLLGNKPKSGTINMGAGSGTTGTGNGWFLDPTPFESSEFQGSIVNAFSGDAQSGSPAAGKGDFETVFAAELTHCMGLFGNGSSLWSSRTTATTVPDTAEGGGVGKFYTFSGPSIQHLLTSNNAGSGGSDFGAAIHSAGPITTTINGTTYVGAQDQGNAVYEFSRRYMVNNAFSLMFKDAYGYSSIDPSKYGTMYSSINETTHQLLVRGGTGTSDDNISITRVGNTLRVSVDVGLDVAGTGALPGAGNLPAFVSEYDISTVSSILIGASDGNDVVSLDSDLGMNVSLSGGNGTDTLVLNGNASNNSFAYSGTAASAGTTNVVSILTTENVSVNGGDGIDSLTLTGSTAAETLTVNANDFAGARIGTFNSVESLLINTLGGADTVNINGPTASTLIDVGVSGDFVNVNETLPGLPASLLATATGATNSIVSVNDASGVANLALPADLTIANLTLNSGGLVDGASNLTLTTRLDFNGGTIAGAGSLTVNSGATVNVATPAVKTLARRLQSASGINVSDGTLAIAAGLSATSAAVIATDLAVSPTAAVDLADNAMIIDYSATSPLSVISAALATGYAGGAWTGLGIRSSSAAAAGGSRTLGYGEATTVFDTFPATFAGAAVDNTAVLIRYTIPGDASLDGAVNFDDLLRTAQNYEGVGKTFAEGNFDYDALGNVNFDDLLLVAQNYETSLVTLPKRTTSAAKRRTSDSASRLV